MSQPASLRQTPPQQSAPVSSKTLQPNVQPVESPQRQELVESPPAKIEFKPQNKQATPLDEGKQAPVLSDDTSAKQTPKQKASKTEQKTEQKEAAKVKEKPKDKQIQTELLQKHASSQQTEADLKKCRVCGEILEIILKKAEDLYNYSDSEPEQL